MTGALALRETFYLTGIAEKSTGAENRGHPGMRKRKPQISPCSDDSAEDLGDVSRFRQKCEKTRFFVLNFKLSSGAGCHVTR
jgi:hypothetical protein